MKNSIEPEKGENKIILFTNLKGGVGKTTLCDFFSNFMAEHGYKVVVIDADPQQSLYRHRVRELEANPDVPPTWEVQPLGVSDPSVAQKIIDRCKELPCNVIFDCPGNLQDPILPILFEAADIAVIPIRYDSDSLDATKLFCSVLKKKSKAEIFFIPNSIAVVEERREEVQMERDKAIEVLKEFGTVTPRIKQSVVIKCYSTILPLTYYQRNAVKYAFDPIIKTVGKR